MSLLRPSFAALTVLALALATRAQAQAPAPAANRPSMGVGEIVGRLADSASGRPVGSGSVTVRRAGDSTFANGALPKADGSFRVDGLAPGRYTLRVRALGFAPVVRNDIVIAPAKPLVDVGVIKLNTVAAKLAGQEVLGEREATVLAPDRTSYSTKNMSAVSGGTAVDVLRNIPLVEVDGQNKVSLRGNENVVIQINGRSTPLKGEQLGTFLAQLPSGTVKTVEVATNPSAKDDPEGTAGIINILLNQEAELGLSGGLTAGTATTGQVNLSGNVGQQRGKLTMFVSGNVYRDRRTTSGTISRTNLVVPSPVFVETTLDGKARPLSGGGNVRSEYRFDDHTSLSFDGYAFLGHYGNDNQSAYTDLDGSRTIIGQFSQTNASSFHNTSLDLDFTFRKLTAQNAPKFSVELEYANNLNNSDVNLSGNLLKADISMPAAIPREHDRGENRFPYVNFKTDYAHQFGTTTKLEAGFKGISRTQGNDFAASYLNTATGLFEPSAARTTSFDYHEDIGAVYGLLSNRIDKVQTQLGLRLEDAATRFTITGNSNSFDKHYTSAYPSAILSYNITQTRQAKVSYSRRVSRPNPFQLNPIENRLDTRNVFRGNPDLQAEYTDAVEFGIQEARSWGSIQLGPYVRHTNHAVRNIQFVDSTGVSVSTFANVASTLTTGADLNVNFRHGPLTLGTGGSAYRYKSDASNLSGNLSTNAIIWAARVNSTWKFSSLADAQFLTAYRAPAKTEGGSSLAMINMNIGGRYKIWGDQGNISVRLSDPFKLQKFGYKTANGTVVETSERFFGSRALFIGITRNFGQALKLTPKPQDQDAISAPTPGTP